MNGNELACEIHARDTALPILFATGYSSITSNVIVDLSPLPKPFQQTEFAAAVACLVLASGGSRAVAGPPASPRDRLSVFRAARVGR